MPNPSCMAIVWSPAIGRHAVYCMGSWQWWGNILSGIFAGPLWLPCEIICALQTGWFLYVRGGVWWGARAACVCNKKRKSRMMTQQFKVQTTRLPTVCAHLQVMLIGMAPEREQAKFLFDLLDTDKSGRLLCSKLLCWRPNEPRQLLVPPPPGFLNFEEIKWLAKLEAEVGQWVSPNLWCYCARLQGDWMFA